MKKVAIIFSTILLSFLLMQDSVFAESNMGTETDDIGGCKIGDYADSCLSISYDGVRITIVDENGQRIPGTKSVDYMTDDANPSAGYKSKTKISTEVYYNHSLNDRKEVLAKSITGLFTKTTAEITFDRLPDLENFIGSEGTGLATNYFEEYFKDMSDDDFSNKILGATGYLDLINNDKDMCEWTEDVYFVVEPLAYINTVNGSYFGTGTELAYQAYNSSAFDTMLDGPSQIIKKILSYAIFVRDDKEDFAGYEGVPTTMTSVAKNKQLDPKKGYSVGIYRAKDYYEIPCKFCPDDSDYPGQPYTNIEECYKYTCYTYDITCSNDSCSKDNANTSRVCSGSTVAFKTDNLSDCDLSNIADGKKTYTLKENTCSLYCVETGTASYPGNVRPAILTGTNLVWPTAGEDNRYPLTTLTKLTCKVRMEEDASSSVTQECLELAATANYVYSGNNAVAKLSYHDTKETQTVNLQSNCATSSTVNGEDVVIENSCRYTLPENKNIAINKETLAFINQDLISAVTNYILITKYKGVLPIGGFDWTDSSIISSIAFDEEYDLEILDLPLGYGGQFTDALNDTPYICNYQVTTVIGGECVCPPGTEWSEVDLYGAMKDKAQTCAEAKEIYCNKDRLTCTKKDGTPVNITDCVKIEKDIEVCNEIWCPQGEDDDPPTCPEDSSYPGYEYEKDTSYKSCISGGKLTQQECRDLICNCGTACQHYCPPGTDFEGMDISNCVYEQRGFGKNLYQAKQYCEKKCNDDDAGNVIYRTISLENPFPSKDANGGVEGFNDNVEGRYPGTNWNGVTLVYNKILNNRGYDGSAIYNEATPLYTINLDPTAIKKIREYNKIQITNGKGGYADFELTCTDGAYCISSFLHNSGITNADGSSILNVSESTCGNARDKSSFISCYTYR